MYVPRSQRMLDQYLQEIGQIPLLTAEQEVALPGFALFLVMLFHKLLHCWLRNPTR